MQVRWEFVVFQKQQPHSGITQQVNFSAAILIPDALFSHKKKNPFICSPESNTLRGECEPVMETTHKFQLRDIFVSSKLWSGTTL